jgi:serine protease Do
MRLPTGKELYTASVGALAAAAMITIGEVAIAAEPHAVNAAPAPAVGPAGLPSFADIVSRVAPAVVSIDIEGKTAPQHTVLQGGQDGDQDPFDGSPFPPELRRFFGPGGPEGFGGRLVPQQPMRATGSGFFISADGYICTNNHVVENAAKITVRTNDGRELKARLIGHDPATDLAVIKVDGGNFPFVSFEDRAKPRVGDWVVAVGNPFNLGGTATAGIVSALNRANVSGSSYVDYMQIDAPINRGNSGGPTFDLYGRVVGVNSAIYSPSGGSVGIGFDIPAEVAAKVTHDLIADGKVTRGFIGATVQDIGDDIAEGLGVKAKEGALVADVTPGGPSDHAGLQSGDIVLSVNGAPVHSAGDLTKQVGMAKAGSTIHMLVRRNGHEQTLAVVSGVRPSEEQLAAGYGRAGPGGEDGDAAQPFSFGMMVSPNPGGGLKVEQVQPGSEAADKGIRQGDIIEQVSGKKAASADDVKAAVEAARKAGRKNVVVRVARQGQHLFLPLEIGAKG